MIYTVTFNPSLDYLVSVDGFQLGMTNRTKAELVLPGGKGLNVSIVLKALGMENVALGFTAGFVGEEIKRQIQEYGIDTEFIDVKSGVSRINVKLKSVDGTEINGMGPDISEKELNLLWDKLRLLTEGDVLVLAGSIPAAMSDDIYENIIKVMSEKKVIVVVDATGKLLLNVLPYHPFLIKPNHHELGELFDVSITEKKEVAYYGKKLQEKGAGNVLVSMGGQGAVLVTEDGCVYEAKAPVGKLVNSVGAGDSMVAGFITGYLKTNNYEEAFKMGVAAGSASAFSENLATKEAVELVYKRVIIDSEKRIVE